MIGATTLLMAALLAKTPQAPSSPAPSSPPPADPCGHGQPNRFVIDVDLVNGVIQPPSNRTYSGEIVIVCVTAFDARYRLTVGATETPLPPPPDLTKFANNKMTAQPIDGIQSALDDASKNRLAATKAIKDVLNAVVGKIAISRDDSDTDRNTLQRNAGTLNNLAGLVSQLEKQLNGITPPPDAARKQAAAAAIQALKDGFASDAKWVKAAQTAAAQLAAATSRPIFQLSPGSDTKVVITVKGTGLVETPADNATDPPTLTDGPSVDLVSTTIEVRSLTYVRVAPGLAFTEVRDRNYSLAPNELGTSTITGRDPSGVVGMLFFGHYWCGVDIRETQPWDTSRPCWSDNLLPTFTVGLPLSRNPAENFFVGLLWQPIPAISFIYGAHLGYVNRLREDFVEGAAPPPVPTGFRIEDATEHRWVIGQFAAIAISDALFVSAIQKLSQ